jgi:hypothetical protein
MAKFGLDFQIADDLFNQAMCTVLRGMEDGDAGRKPNPEDLLSKDTFLNYLRGVINSVVEGWWRADRTRHRKDHCSLDLIQDYLAAPRDTQVEFADLNTQLFTQLRQRAHARLLPTINEWEQAPDGKIPCVTSRKHTAAVKLLARQIAVGLGFTPEKKKPPGGLPGGAADVLGAYAEA